LDWARLVFVGKQKAIKGDNPVIYFTNPDPGSVEVFTTSELVFEPVWSIDPDQMETSVVTTKVASRCKAPKVAGKVFFGLTKTNSDGGEATAFYQYDRRLKWIDNSLETPASVTAEEYTGGRHGVCPSVPRTFVNQNSCVRLPPGTCTNPVFLSRMVTLDETTLKQWFELSHKYVYAIKGLRMEVGEPEWIPPCTALRVSRWVRVAAVGEGGCSGADLDSPVLSGDTANVVRAAIAAHEGSGSGDTPMHNPVIRDVRVADYTADNGGECSM
jgi:hypothetical protein